MTLPRTEFLRCRVNQEELAMVEAMIHSLDSRRAHKFGSEIAERLSEAAPFATVSDFLRVCCGLDPLRDPEDASTGRPRSKTPSKSALHRRAGRGDEEARKMLEEMGVKRRAKRKKDD